MVKLTKAESEVYRLLLKGLSKKEIAKIRGVETSTVATQTLNIFYKLEAYSVHELMARRIEELENELSRYC